MSGSSATWRCGVCGKSKPAEEPYKYGYPIPAKYGPHHNHEGLKLCLDCWPAFHQAQLDEGLVVYVERQAHHVAG